MGSLQTNFWSTLLPMLLMVAQVVNRNRSKTGRGLRRLTPIVDDNRLLLSEKKNIPKISSLHNIVLQPRSRITVKVMSSVAMGTSFASSSTNFQNGHQKHSYYCCQYYYTAITTMKWHDNMVTSLKARFEKETRLKYIFCTKKTSKLISSLSKWNFRKRNQWSSHW